MTSCMRYDVILYDSKYWSAERERDVYLNEFGNIETPLVQFFTDASVEIISLCTLNMLDFFHGYKQCKNK